MELTVNGLTVRAVKGIRLSLHDGVLDISLENSRLALPKTKQLLLKSAEIVGKNLLPDNFEEKKSGRKPNPNSLYNVVNDWLHEKLKVNGMSKTDIINEAKEKFKNANQNTIISYILQSKGIKREYGWWSLKSNE